MLTTTLGAVRRRRVPAYFRMDMTRYFHWDGHELYELTLTGGEQLNREVFGDSRTVDYINHSAFVAVQDERLSNGSRAIKYTGAA